MSLNVGGIHVLAKKGIDRARVVAAIKAHWKAIGAKPLKGDPLALEPLSVQKTGKVGFIVADQGTDATKKKREWIAIYDSERYHADPELARALAKELATLVVIWSFSGSVDQASAGAYGPGAAEMKKELGASWGKIEKAVGNLPYAFIYFNKLKDDGVDMSQLEAFGFEKIPYRKDAQYRGPSEGEKKRMGAEEDANTLVESGDVPAIRALWKSKPDLRHRLLAQIYDLDEKKPETAKTVLAFASEIIADKSYWRTEKLARSALREDDEATFARATEALGDRAMALEFFAHELLQAKDFPRALRAFRAATRSKTATVTAWNNLAYTLIFAPCDRQEARALLKEAEERGPKNPAIFHNTACVWVKLGDKDAALAAVANAVRCNYELVDRMRTDDDLAPIRDDPRFAAAFEAKPAIGLDELVTVVQHGKRAHVVQRPVVMMDFFLENRLPPEVCPGIAELLDAYIADVPKNALCKYRVRGPWKKISPGTITRDKKKLCEAKKSHFVDIAYRGETDDGGGDATPHGIEIEVWGADDDFGDHTHVPHVALWFPPSDDDVEALVERFGRYAKLVRVEAAACGLHVLTRRSDYVETWWHDSTMQDMAEKRFICHETHPFREWQQERAPGVSWLTLVSKKIAPKSMKLGAAKTIDLGDSICIRASMRPTLVQEGFGALPSVARALKPIRLVEEKNAEATARYARFDALEDGPFSPG
jgi:tetratricopeptide (TPR) repeat protein